MSLSLSLTPPRRCDKCVASAPLSLGSPDAGPYRLMLTEHCSTVCCANLARNVEKFKRFSAMERLILPGLGWLSGSLSDHGSVLPSFNIDWYDNP
jgi:hypothetical protein